MSKRLSSAWRKSAFAKLVEIDGEYCAKCGNAGRTIWRQMGVWGGWVDDDGAIWGRYTKVYPTSNLEVDHCLALHNGGSNHFDNLWLLCRECHKAKTSEEQSQRLKRLFAEARK